MKELSIEEKATRYDDAIKKTKSLYEVSEPLSGCNVIIETIFPELKESEEERIRKYLIRYIDNTMKSSELKSKLLAWLEKQGEQKPAWSEEDDVMIKVFDSIIRYIVEVVDKDVLERFGTNREELFSWLKSLKQRMGG